MQHLQSRLIELSSGLDLLQNKLSVSTIKIDKLVWSDEAIPDLYNMPFMCIVETDALIREIVVAAMNRPQYFNVNDFCFDVRSKFILQIKAFLNTLDKATAYAKGYIFDLYCHIKNVLEDELGYPLTSRKIKYFILTDEDLIVFTGDEK